MTLTYFPQQTYDKYRPGLWGLATAHGDFSTYTPYKSPAWLHACIVTLCRRMQCRVMWQHHVLQWRHVCRLQRWLGSLQVPPALHRTILRIK